MKVFHNKRPDYDLRSEVCPQGISILCPEWMWGNIITDETKRSEQQYATLIAPDGTKANAINRSTYKWLLTNLRCRPEHVYFKPLAGEEFLNLREGVKRMDRFQIAILEEDILQLKFRCKM